MPANPLIAMQLYAKSIPEVTAIVSTRIYLPDSIPTNPQMPYCLIPGTTSDIGDACTSSSDNGHTRVQISMFASSDATVERLTQILKKKIPCGEKILSAGPDPDTNVPQFLRVSSIDDAGGRSDADYTAKIFTRHRDFLISCAY